MLFVGSLHALTRVPIFGAPYLDQFKAVRQSSSTKAVEFYKETIAHMTVGLTGSLVSEIWSFESAHSETTTFQQLQLFQANRLQ